MTALLFDSLHAADGPKGAQGSAMALGVAGQTELLHRDSIVDVDTGSCVLGTVLSLVERETSSTLVW